MFKDYRDLIYIFDIFHILRFYIHLCYICAKHEHYIPKHTLNTYTTKQYELCDCVCSA